MVILQEIFNKFSRLETDTVAVDDIKQTNNSGKLFMTVQIIMGYRDRNKTCRQPFAFSAWFFDSCHRHRHKILMLSKCIMIIMVFFFASLDVHASEAGLARLMSGIEKKQSTHELKRYTIAMGKERALLCNQCHGDDGNSKKLGVPNLAGQNSEYLLGQIEKFSDGRRKNFVMNALSKNFSRDDKENLAVFYANMKVNITKTNTQLAKKGQPLYTRMCRGCHGKRGTGRAKYARLAGQQTYYIETTLKQFRDNSKHNGKSSKRSSAIMEPIVKGLSDDDVKALAAYVSQLK